MDPAFIELLSKKLGIKKQVLSEAYNETINELSESSRQREHYCSYKFMTGVNKNKECGLLLKNIKKEATFVIDEKRYCRAHYEALTNKAVKASKLVIKDISKNIITEQKIETSQKGNHTVIAGTLLIVDQNTNQCTGAIRQQDQLTPKITKEEKELLEKLNIDHHKCSVIEDNNDSEDDLEDIAKNLLNIEEKELDT